MTDVFSVDTYVVVAVAVVVVNDNDSPTVESVLICISVTADCGACIGSALFVYATGAVVKFFLSVRIDNKVNNIMIKANIKLHVCPVVEFGAYIICLFDHF